MWLLRPTGLAVIMALSLAVGVLPGSVLAGGTGRIVFESDRDGNFEIYSMNADGTDLARLTTDPESDTTPSWTADGQRIAFTSFRDGNGQIYVMNADGSGEVRLSRNTFNDMDPAWSPDNARIAFVTDRNGGSEIWTMNADGTEQTRLTYVSFEQARLPSWTPDGTRIAFESIPIGQTAARICHIGVNGTGRTVVAVTDIEEVTNPAPGHHSPEGLALSGMILRQLGYESTVSDWEIFTTTIDGTGQTRLTDSLGTDSDPAWSPDDSQIAFVSWRDGNPEIYIMNADGRGQTRLTNSPGYDWHPAWTGKAAMPVIAVPGGAGLPTDPDSDGKYEDVNGNGRKDFADITLYFTQMTWIAENEPLAAFDYNGNGRIDFADVTALFHQL
jgi:Tol biopolymer transport system component